MIPAAANYSRNHLTRRKLIRHARGSRSQSSQIRASASSVGMIHACSNSEGCNLHPAQMEAALQQDLFPNAGGWYPCVLATFNEVAEQCLQTRAAKGRPLMPHVLGR